MHVHNSDNRKMVEVMLFLSLPILTNQGKPRNFFMSYKQTGINYFYREIELFLIVSL